MHPTPEKFNLSIQKLYFKKNLFSESFASQNIKFKFVKFKMNPKNMIPNFKINHPKFPDVKNLNPSDFD